MEPANAMHTAGMMKKPVGMMKKPAGEMKKAVGEMKKAAGEKKAVKNVVLKRPSAAAPCPGVPTKKADPMRVNGWTVYTDLNAKAWRCKHPSSRCDKAASWKTGVHAAWEKVQHIVNTEL